MAGKLIKSYLRNIMTSTFVAFSRRQGVTLVQNKKDVASISEPNTSLLNALHFYFGLVIIFLSSVRNGCFSEGSVSDPNFIFLAVNGWSGLKYLNTHCNGFS